MKRKISYLVIYKTHPNLGDLLDAVDAEHEHPGPGRGALAQHALAVHREVPRHLALRDALWRLLEFQNLGDGC